MPSVLDKNEAKWTYGSTVTRDGVIAGGEVQGIRYATTTAQAALEQAQRQGLQDVQVAHCTTEDGEPHSVCIIGDFAIDHKQDWITVKEDLPYAWVE